MKSEIRDYNKALSANDRSIAEALFELISKELPDAEYKIWHQHPVWFLNGNPVAGYNKLKDCVRLFFWSGQSFDEQELIASGTFKAAEVRYQSSNEIVAKDVKRWLKKAREIQWDYKNIVKRKGRLVRLEVPPVA